MTDPQPAADPVAPIEADPVTQVEADPVASIDADPVAQVEAAAARLGSPDQSAAVPLAELAEQLTSLHEQLQSALSELDRT